MHTSGYAGVSSAGDYRTPARIRSSKMSQGGPNMAAHGLQRRVATAAAAVTIVAITALLITPAHSTHNGQRWSRQVQNPNGFVNIAGSDWVPVQQFPTTRSVAPLNSDRQSAARVLNFAPPHLQPQNPYFPQQQSQQQQQQQQHQQNLLQAQSQQHLNTIEPRPQPQHLPFASSADPFQLITNNGAPHRFHVPQSQGLQFHQAPISQQNQQFFQSHAPLQTAAPQPQFQYAHQQQQQLPAFLTPQQQHVQQHQQQPQHLLQQQLPQQQQSHPLPQHQALVLNPAELNQQYQFPQFVQQHQPSENVQLQPQPLQHVLQQQYEVHQQGPPSFMRHEPFPVEHRKQPHTEPLIQRAPQLYGQEPEPKVRPNRPGESEPDEEVQLLYVPLDTLYKQQSEQRQQQASATQQKPPAATSSQSIKYNVQPVNPLQINNFYTASPATVKPNATPSSPAYQSSPSPAYVFEGSTQRYVQQSPATTPKPKVKPHQPPLAMFMVHGATSADVSVNEVLHALKNARNIDVLDSASKKAPKVFVGPSGLRTPSGYSKFELPYLSSIEQNRGVNQLPFFVAPLSYKAPKGFAKIPLPAPHVGSVVVNSPPELVQYQPIELPVQQQQQQQQQNVRTQSYPKKVQSVAAPLAVQALDQSSAYRTTSKPKYGFMLGRDVFTTTAKPAYYSPTSLAPTTTAPTPTASRYQFVSSTSAPLADQQYSRFPDFSGNANVRNPLSTAAPAPSDHSQHYQVSASLATADNDEPFVPMTTPKPSGRYESSFGRFGQRGTPATTRASPAPTAESPSTRIPFNYEQFVRPSAQPTVPTYTPQQNSGDYSRFAGSPSTRAPVKPSLSTYSAQQHEEQEYSRFPTPSAPSSSVVSLKPNPSVSSASNVQSEEYFNIQKTPQMESFATANQTDTYATNLFNQFHPSKDDYSVPQVTTSSDSTASAPKPTAAENYSFVPLITAKPATPRPEVTYTSKPAELSTRAQEIYNMKNYFREQTAFKSRPQQLSASGEESDVVSRPAYSSFERNVPSSTPQYVYVRSTTTTTTTEPSDAEVEQAASTESNFIERSTPRNTITYYTPSSNNAEESPKSVHHFKFVQSVTGRPEQQSHREVYRTSTESTLRDDKRIYSNHRDSYADPSPATPKVRLFEYERSTAASPVTHSAYEHSSTAAQQHAANDDYNNLIRESIQQNQAAEVSELTAYEEASANPYNLPSELPPISASLPGMVNSLFVDSEPAHRETVAATTIEPSTVSTRRTPHRGRRPQPTYTTAAGSSRATATRAPVTRAPRTTTTSTTASPDYGSSGDYVASTRRTTVRGRRPIHYANRTTTIRTPTVRNPNRVRYNPTSEERQRVRNKQKAAGTKDEDLDYQRDVLKQNYPAVVSQRSPAVSTEATPSGSTAVSMVHETERYSSHYRATEEDAATGGDYYQNVASPTPSTYASADEAFPSSTARSSVFDDLPQHFSGLADHMQIPQEHQSLIGEYYNSESDVSAVDAINNGGHRSGENRPVFLTTPSSTTEEIQAIQENAVEPQRTRRPNFVRRPVTGGSRPVYGTSTEATERFTVRPKVRNDPTSAYTPKPRTNRIRTRGSTTTTTTAEPVTADEQSGNDQNYQQISRFNKDFYQDAPRHRNFQRPSAKSVRGGEQKRFKYESFALDTQESQWSTKISENSFRPVEEDSPKTAKSLKSEFSRDTEPDIVTAGPSAAAEANGETYLLKVSSSLNGNSAPVETTTTSSTTASDKSFVDLLGEAMSELGNEIVGKNNNAADAEDHTDEVATITTTVPSVADNAPDASSIASSSSGSGSKRRGVWKRVRVRPSDGFETAESQNYGSRIYNSIAAASSKEEHQQQLNKNADKVVTNSGAFHSFNLDESNDADVTVKATTTSAPISTASSPGDVDLGTGAPVLATMATLGQQAVDSTVLAPRVETTPMPDEVAGDEDIETEKPKPAEDQEPADSAPLTSTVTSTRRYDIGDGLILDDDHTEFPFAFQPFEDNTEMGPSASATTDLPYYDDYDVDFRTSPSPDATIAAAVDSSSAPASSSSSGGSLMSDVKQKLSELFSFANDYADYGETNAVLKPLQPLYTTIERVKPTAEIAASSNDNDTDNEVRPLTMNPLMAAMQPSTTTEASTTAKSFHRNLMDSVIYATSTSTEVSHETEICYRGRCIKTDKKLH